MSKKHKEGPTDFVACSGYVNLVLAGEEGSDGRFNHDQGGFRMPMDRYREADVLLTNTGTLALHLKGDPADTTYVMEDDKLVMYTSGKKRGTPNKGPSFSAIQDVLVELNDESALVANWWEDQSIK